MQRFLGTVLGFRQDPHLDWSYHINATQGIEVEPPPTPAPADRVAHVAFATPDCEAMHAYLAAHGVAVEERVNGAGATHWFGFRDAAGNPFEFVQAAPFRDPPQDAVAQRLAEAGFVVTDAVAEAHLFGDVLGFRRLPAARRPGRGKIAWQVPGSTDVVAYTVLAPGPRFTAQQAGAGNYYAFAVADLRAARRRLRAEGWHGGVLHDPEGTRVVLLRRAASRERGAE